MQKPIIAVLLATYNGEKYLAEQLHSIIYQKEVKCTMVWVWGRCVLAVCSLKERLANKLK
jgi:hypothetical protein